jgi:hypothetical protein
MRSAHKTLPIEHRVVALAEQVGRLAGTVRGKADGLIDRPALKLHLGHIRESVTALLEHVTRDKGGAGKTPEAAPLKRDHDAVRAPGKKHRKAPQRRPGIPHSDETIAKVSVARMRKQGRRG